MNASDIKLIKALLQRVKTFNDGCGCCATVEAKDTDEYKALDHLITRLAESN